MMRKTQTILFRTTWLPVLALLLLSVALLLSGCPSVKAPPTALPAPPPPAVPAATMVTPAEADKDQAPTLTPQITVIATRLMAKAVGELNEVNGCLRLGKDTLAWPPEFDVVRKDSILRVVGRWGKGETWEFRIGDVITIGAGGRIDLTEQERQVLRVPPGCPGPYLVFGGGTDEFLIRPTK